MREPQGERGEMQRGFPLLVACVDDQQIDGGTEPRELLGPAAVLRMRLHVTERGEPSDILFAEDHAREIRKFLDAWPNAERVVVHCNAGVSRSPGVALGLCDVRGWATAALERSHPGWNRLVRTLLAAERKA